MDPRADVPPRTHPVARAAGAASARFCYAPARPQHASTPFPRQVPRDTYARLLPLFAPQRTDASCSVASATLVLNALLRARGEPAVDQAWVVASDETAAWARATADARCVGVGLQALASHLTRLLRLCAIDGAVCVHHVAAANAPEASQFRAVLSKLEDKTRERLVVVNFVQSMLLGDGEAVGHMSVVGGFDVRRDRVLIFDVDPDGLVPYWVEVAALMQAMGTDDRAEEHSRGYIVVAATPREDGDVPGRRRAGACGARNVNEVRPTSKEVSPQRASLALSRARSGRARSAR